MLRGKNTVQDTRRKIRITKRGEDNNKNRRENEKSEGELNKGKR